MEDDSCGGVSNPFFVYKDSAEMKEIHALSGKGYALLHKNPPP